ncbi:hypothetical protein Tco_0422488 [Tanacetum coccineum]
MVSITSGGSSESVLVSDEDSDPEQAQRDKEMQKNLALLAESISRSSTKPTNLPTTTSNFFKPTPGNKTEDTTHQEKSLVYALSANKLNKVFPHQAEQADLAKDTDEEI